MELQVYVNPMGNAKFKARDCLSGIIRPVMKQKQSKRLLYGVTVAQATAIGYMTIQFNWLEHAVEVLITMIAVKENHELLDPLVKRTEFSRKLNTLEKVVASLPNFVASSNETA